MTQAVPWAGRVLRRCNAAPEDILKDKGQYTELGKAAAKDIPNCTLVELPYVGHIPHLEAPEQLHQALLAFLQANYKP